MPPNTAAVKQRLRHELKEFFLIFLYLYVCLGMLTIYKSLSLQTYGIEFAPYGFALVKSLVLAKFIMVLHALPIGRGLDRQPLIYPTLYKAFIFFIGLFLLSLAEEAVVGMWHGKTLIAAASQLGGGTLAGVSAGCVATFFFLIPYFALRQLGGALGEGRLYDLFFGQVRPAP